MEWRVLLEALKIKQKFTEALQFTIRNEKKHNKTQIIITSKKDEATERKSLSFIPPVSSLQGLKPLLPRKSWDK